MTEIESAAILWERDAASMKEAIVLHHGILRTVLREFKGYEVVVRSAVSRTAIEGLIISIEDTR